MDRTIETTPVVPQGDEWHTILTPTGAAYGSFNHAFDMFNKELFGNQLPDVLFTMQRKGQSFGYYSEDRFGTRSETETKLDEIALNPAMMQGRTDREIAGTLAHEMCHLGQHKFGHASRSGYHNKEFAQMMEQIGLITSHTGLPGGRRTGQHMSHYIVDGSPFDLVWHKLAAEGFKFEYHDRLFDRRESAKKNKSDYLCDTCGLKLWGKPGITDVPLHCGRPMAEKKHD